MVIESRNTIDKMHWTEKRRLRQTYQVFIRQQMSHHKIDEATEKQVFSLVITTFRKRKIRDHDNLIGGAKQLIDALVNENFIWDDSDKFLSELTITQDKPDSWVRAEDDEYTIISRL